MKHYIISYRKEEKQRLLEELAAFKPKSFSLLERIAISVQDERATSLLEKLSTLPNVSYREAQVYKAL